MSRPATDRLKVNAPLGVKPALRWLRIDEMCVDLTYQRTLEAPQSQSLIRQLAMFWNWDLCQPLTVAKRPNGALMIVDGQHRHAAAKLRGDIDALPCVVAAYANAGDEAATFVALNRVRRPLTALDLFKAALAAEDTEATTILSAITDAGLTIAPHTNCTAWKPGMVSNVGGIQRCFRKRGEAVLRIALATLGRCYPGEILQYAGTLFPGLSAVAVDEVRLRAAPNDIIDPLASIVREKTQGEWRRIIKRAVGESGGMAREASEMVFRRVWRAHKGIAEAPPATREEKPKLSFEEQLARVERWEVGVGPAFHPTKAAPEITLGGVGSGLV